MRVSRRCCTKIRTWSEQWSASSAPADGEAEDFVDDVLDLAILLLLSPELVAGAGGGTAVDALRAPATGFHVSFGCLAGGTDLPGGAAGLVCESQE